MREIKIKRILGAFAFLIIAATIAAFWVTLYFVIAETIYEDDFGAYSDSTSLLSPCNVLGIDLYGSLVTYAGGDDPESPFFSRETSSEDIVSIISEAEKDEEIKAILLQIDSFGGSPVAAEEVANALKRTTKPTVALIREGGLSAAYWVATAADTIFASKLSDIGSIGVTASYLDEAKLNEKEGYTFNSLTTAPFKDYGHPEKTLTQQERALIMRDIEIAHTAFVESVAKNRGLTIEQVNKLADGSSMLGEMALANKLIDRIGDYPEAVQYLKEKIGAEPEVCW